MYVPVVYEISDWARGKIDHHITRNELNKKYKSVEEFLFDPAKYCQVYDAFSGPWDKIYVRARAFISEDEDLGCGKSKDKEDSHDPIDDVNRIVAFSRQIPNSNDVIELRVRPNKGYGQFGILVRVSSKPTKIMSCILNGCVDEFNMIIIRALGVNVKANILALELSIALVNGSMNEILKNPTDIPWSSIGAIYPDDGAGTMVWRLDKWVLAHDMDRCSWKLSYFERPMKWERTMATMKAAHDFLNEYPKSPPLGTTEWIDTSIYVPDLIAHAKENKMMRDEMILKGCLRIMPHIDLIKEEWKTKIRQPDRTGELGDKEKNAMRTYIGYHLESIRLTMLEESTARINERRRYIGLIEREREERRVQDEIRELDENEVTWAYLHSTGLYKPVECKTIIC